MKIYLKNSLTFIASTVFILIGVFCNQWTLGALFSPDGKIDNLSNRIIIWVFDLAFILSGILIIKHRSLFRKIILSTMWIAVMFFIFMETNLRFQALLLHYPAFPNPKISRYLGWETAADIHWKGMHEGYGEIRYSTTRYGFRLFGDINTNKRKVFVIGDSYTEASTVSDGETYYDYLKKHANNVEVFAYGCDGYGSLQEYMILDKYFDMIKPDIILWQFCSNDIINNDHKLESLSIRNNNLLRRPYYMNGKIVWLHPTSAYSRIYSIIKHSYFLRRMFITSARRFSSVENRTLYDHALFKKGIETTSEIMRLVKQRARDIPIIAFSVNETEYSKGVFFAICRSYGIYWINGVPEAISEAKKSGKKVDNEPYNGHWNRTGHAIAGEEILDWLVEKELI